MSGTYTHCPGCGRHCPVDSLSCERGRRIIAATNNDTEDNGGFKKLYDSIDEAEQANNRDFHEKNCCGGNGQKSHCRHHEEHYAHHSKCEHDIMHCAHHGRSQHDDMSCASHGSPGRGTHRKGCAGRGMHRPELDENAPIQQKLLFKMHKCMHYLHGGAHCMAGQSRIISLLNERGEMTQRELTDIAGVRSASISEVLAKLEHRGLIERSKNADDRRNIDVHLTEQGKLAASSLDSSRHMNAEDLFSCLSDEELNSLSVLLDKLISHWNND